MHWRPIMIHKLRRRLTLLVIAALLLVSCGIIISIDLMNRSGIESQAMSALNTLSSLSGNRPASPRDGSTPPPKPGENGEGGPVPADPGQHVTPPPKPGENGFSGSSSPLSSLLQEDDSPDNPPEAATSAEARPQPPFTSGPFGGNPENYASALSRQPMPPPRDPGMSMASLAAYCRVNLDAERHITGWLSDRPDLYDTEVIHDLTARILLTGQSSGRIGWQFFQMTAQEGGTLLLILDAELQYLSAQQTLYATLVTASVACAVLCLGAFILIRRMLAPVQEAFDKQRQFVSDASHELKTPLAVISANVDVLRGEFGENEQISYISSEVRRSSRMVQSLLQLARLDKNTRIPLKKLDLSQLVMEAVLPLESSVYEAGRTLEMEVPEGISCQGDRDMLVQLLIILMNNAVKYSGENGKIFLKLERFGHGARLSLSNTGPGILPEDIDHIFDRFYRGDSAHNRTIDGQGLGLAIARQIVALHKGTLTVSSHPGLTTFTLHLS